MNRETVATHELPPISKLKVLIVAGAILLAIVALMLYNKATRTAQAPHGGMLQNVPVSIASVRQRTLRESISLTGTVFANNDVNVVSETSGRVTAVNVKIGDFVKAGTVLVRVDDELKQAALSSAEVNYEKAKKDWDRYQSLFAKRSITASQYDGARLAFKSAESQFIIARRQANDTRVTSPISGYVSARPVDIGAMLQVGTSVANVVDIATLKVRLNVAERDAFKIKTGDRVEVTTEVYPSVVFTGSVVSIAAKADDAHTYPVEISMPNSKDHPLRAGMFARVGFIAIAAESSMVIPRQALIGSIREPQVYVVKDGAAHLRSLVVASEAGDTLGVQSGLAVGDQVVINGQNNLADGTAVSIIQ